MVKPDERKNMSEFYKIPINTNKRYNVVMGNRGGGKQFYRYVQNELTLYREGEYIMRGFTEPLKPHQEKVYNNILVDMIISQETFRFTHGLINRMSETIIRTRG